MDVRDYDYTAVFMQNNESVIVLNLINTLSIIGLYSFRYGKRSDYDDSDLYEDKRTTLMRYGKRSDDTISADELEYAKRLFRYGE